jgi:guanylate kinase
MSPDPVLSSSDRTQPLLLLISAPSGGGKTTVCQQLLAAVPGLTRVITCTTRPPRPGERDGVDYHFLTPEDFSRRAAAGEFLEHAAVYGQRYGTLRRAVFDELERGRHVLLNVDVQGAASIRRLAATDGPLRDALVSVFLTPPSVEVLAERLNRRGQDTPAVVARRLAEARGEMAAWRDFDYLVLSTTIPDDLRRVRSIFESESMRSRRVAFAPNGGEHHG